ncbi:hypothetical protein ABT084_27870 [Streptomyces sp. NPDC002138]|uniref:hypothetical protein n=1 Tax=Streptomyces sp. NPDC002138 TaxID=3154410 RepID=UPI003330C4F1
MSGLVGSGDVCLDVRAKHGRYTRALAVLAGPTGQVHSVERRLRPIGRLTLGTTLLGCGNVTLHAMVSGDGRQRPGTIDNLCRQVGLTKVNFIKLGSEDLEAALVGAFHTLLRDRPSILLERDDAHFVRCDAARGSLIRSLTVSLGYSMYRWQKNGWEPVTHMTEGPRFHLFTVRSLPRS